MVTFIFINWYEKLYHDNFFAISPSPILTHSYYRKRTSLHNAPANRWMPLEAKVKIPPFKYFEKWSPATLFKKSLLNGHFEKYLQADFCILRQAMTNLSGLICYSTIGEQWHIRLKGISINCRRQSYHLWIVQAKKV